MDEDIKREWVRRLRSGEYRQGVGYLRLKHGLPVEDRDTFCCLGVLVDMAVGEGVVEWHSDDTGVYGVTDGSKMSLGVPPDAVLAWAGLPTDHITSPAVRVGSTTLALLNDNSRFSFEEIADVIEREL